MEEAEKGVYDEHKVSESLVGKWLEKYSGDAGVEKELARLKELGAQVLRAEN